MADKQKFALIGHQRTGTHFFAASLRCAPEVYLYDEVLMPLLEENSAGQGLFFPYFKEALNKDWSNLLLTNFYTFDRVFKKFFDEYSDKAEQSVVGFDLKLDQMQTFPRLFWSLQDWGFKFIHLVRRNYLARMASHLVMNQRMAIGDTDLHYSRQGNHTVRMDVDQTIWWMLDDVEANRAAQQKLRHAGDRYMQVFYEEIASSENERVLSSVFEFLGVSPPKRIEATTIKQATKHLSETIENYDEIIAEINRRGLTDTLSPHL